MSSGNWLTQTHRHCPERFLATLAICLVCVGVHDHAVLSRLYVQIIIAFTVSLTSQPRYRLFLCSSTIFDHTESGSMCSTWQLEPGVILQRSQRRSSLLRSREFGICGKTLSRRLRANLTIDTTKDGSKSRELLDEAQRHLPLERLWILDRRGSNHARNTSEARWGARGTPART